LDDIEVGVVLVWILEHDVDDHFEGPRSELVAGVNQLSGTVCLGKRVVAKLVEVSRHIKD
jgi:hypothetical protein